MTETAERLVIQSGPQSGRETILTGNSITIGRYPLADIVIDDPAVAYRHAVITRGDAGFRIADLGTDAGTYVNGRRIGAEPVPLVHGDIILLGPQISAAFLSGFVGTPEVNDTAAPVTPPIVDAPAGFSEDESAPSSIIEDEYEAPVWESGATDVPPEEVYAESPHYAPIDHTVSLPAMPPPRRKNGRIMLISAGCLLLLLACCCSASLFMYFIGGDWLLSQLGYLP